MTTRIKKATLILSAVLFFSKIFSQVQTQSPVYVSMTPNSGGYYESLPVTYNSTSQNFPLLLFVHGAGEMGNGSPSQLPLVLRNGPPKLINMGLFPSSFTVNGQTFSFIVISPQFIAWPQPQDIQDIINYLIQHYRVDQNRIYLTGLSMGGGITWEYPGNQSAYANRLAAIVPVAGASYPDMTRCTVIADANLPVWATHNDSDHVVPSWYTINYVNNINAPVPSPPNFPPTPSAKKTIFHDSTHNAWDTTYNPNWTENGLNVYQWMLQYQRNIGVLPVLLSDFRVVATASNQVTVSWKTSQEQNNAYFTVQRSADAVRFTDLINISATNQPSGSNYSYIDRNPLQGDSYYRLVQTDLNGRKTYFEIKKIIIDNSIKNSIQIFPNPAENTLLVKMDNELKGKIEIRMIDEQGKFIRQFSWDKPNNYLEKQISISDIRPGYYILEIRGKNYFSKAPFIKK